MEELIKRANAGEFDPNHKTIQLSYHGKHLEIDEKIAPLISKLWKHGINTKFSCQGEPNGDSAYITFNKTKDIYKFSQIRNKHVQVTFDLITEDNLITLSEDELRDVNIDTGLISVRFDSNDIKKIL